MVIPEVSSTGDPLEVGYGLARARRALLATVFSGS